MLPLPQAGQLTLYLPGSRRSIEIRPSPEVTLGRKDPRSGITPDIDLTEDEGRQAGVSRMHAAIRSRDGQFVLVDLGSANGTFHNGRPLRRAEQSPVADGDEIRLGDLVLRVYV